MHLAAKRIVEWEIACYKRACTHTNRHHNTHSLCVMRDTRKAREKRKYKKWKKNEPTHKPEVCCVSVTSDLMMCMCLLTQSLSRTVYKCYMLCVSRVSRNTQRRFFVYDKKRSKAKKVKGPRVCVYMTIDIIAAHTCLPLFVAHRRCAFLYTLLVLCAMIVCTFHWHGRTPETFNRGRPFFTIS